tara:strand:+ start:108 stop:383 length:276 start_codon:yes stop_codon:yes gene_type:complete
MNRKQYEASAYLMFFLILGLFSLVIGLFFNVYNANRIEDIIGYSCIFGIMIIFLIYLLYVTIRSVDRYNRDNLLNTKTVVYADFWKEVNNK